MTKFAIFGLGGIGAYHRAAVERQERNGRGRLVAVAEPFVERMAEAKRELDARGVPWHTDYRELLREEKEAEVMVIATPIQLHDEMARACLDHGAFINLEKPPVPTIQQLEALIAIAGSERVSVGFQMIGSPGMQALKALVCEGRIGEVRSIYAGGCWPRLESYYTRARWAGRMALDGKPVLDGPATNAFAHLIHNIMFLAGEGRRNFAVPAEVRGELYRARRIQSYDAACMRGRFSSGIEFSVAVTHATQMALPYRMEVRGTKGWARISKDGAILETSRGIEVDQPEGTQQLLDRDYDYLLDVLEGREERPRTCLKDARGYVSATNGMMLSSGGIHDIDPACIRIYQGEGAPGMDVVNLREAVLETLTSGRLFSEQGYPWATARPATVALAGEELGRRMEALVAGY